MYEVTTDVLDFLGQPSYLMFLKKRKHDLKSLLRY